MQCMEVWGGNHVIDTSIQLAGLTAWIYSRPQGEPEGGGDVYYASSCATGRITRMVLADVSGHGMTASEPAVILRDLMRRYVNHIDQGQFVQAMNGRFSELSSGERFATAVAVTFFAPTNQLELVNAGHPPPLHYKAAESSWEYLQQIEDVSEPTNLPLGFHDLSCYTTLQVNLAPDDLILCYTDALIESVDPSGQMIGQTGLLDLVRQLDPREPAEARSALLERLVDQHPDNLDRDDLTVLLFRPTGAVLRSVKNQIMGAALMAGRVLSGLRPGGPPTPWPELTLRNLGGALFDRFNR